MKYVCIHVYLYIHIHRYVHMYILAVHGSPQINYYLKRFRLVTQQTCLLGDKADMSAVSHCTNVSSRHDRHVGYVTQQICFLWYMADMSGV